MTVAASMLRHGEGVTGGPSPLPGRDEALLSLQCVILRAIASGMPFAAVADLLCRQVEEIVPTISCSVVGVDAERRLRPLAGPSLPERYCQAIDGLPIGPMVGSCGAAAHLGHAVEVHDIETDPRWAPYRALPLAAGLRACWSTPIRTPDDRIVATFAFYYRTRRGPDALERQIVAASVDLCALAIEREAVAASLATSNRHLEVALQSMTQGLGLYDAQDRLLLTNRRFHDIYGLAAERLRPGVHFREVLAHSIAAGNYPGQTVDDLWQARKAFIDRHKPGVFLQRLGDGRVIAISHQPLADGGWVATYEDVTEQQKRQERMAHLAQHDVLTGLPNRAVFEEQLEAALRRPGAAARCAVLYLDLDRFKTINDTLGHATGDRLLQAVAGRLRGCVRDGDVVARLGGDEFSILLPAVAGAEEVGALSRRIAEALSLPYVLGGHTVASGTSIGIALAPAEGGTASQMLQQADLALYQAKAEGRGTHRFYAPLMDELLRRRQQFELDLRHAVQAGEFELHYQPLFDLRSRRICGFEALLRWHHPLRGAVLPGEFIPVAEEIGLIAPLGAWVLRQACRDAAGWPEGIRVAVNLSPSQLQDPRLVGQVRAALAESGLPAARLELEITESVLLSVSPEVLGTLHGLRALGLRVALDDFGTGYSSLSCLHHFPFDKIKIDRSFVADMAAGGNALAIVRAVAGLGRDLCMVTTAEGVETAAQLEQARAQGCTEVQGYLLGHPQPAARVAAMLRESGFPAGDEALPGASRQAP